MRPKKKWGQNFLRNRSAAEKIVAAVEAEPDEVVLEIGPGEGVLTELLVARYPGQVVAVEIDPSLVASLRVRFGSALEIIEGDALEVPLPTRPFRAVGNLPYYVATPILHRVIADDNFRRAVFMLQKEVADRLVAKPSTPAYGYLTLYTQVFASAKLLMTLEAGSFYPPPKVRSGVVVLEAALARYSCSRATLIDLISTAFHMRRKKLANNLEGWRNRSRQTVNAVIASIGLDKSVRAEEMELEHFDALCRALSPS